MKYDEFKTAVDRIIEDEDTLMIHASPDFQCDQTLGFPSSLCVCWEQGKAWLAPNDFMISDLPEEQKQMIPLEKQSKREQRKFHADKRGSWNGIKPTTRTVESRKVYDRNRIRKAERRNACE